jgi:hypothetical protein
MQIASNTLDTVTAQKEISMAPIKKQLDALTKKGKAPGLEVPDGSELERNPRIRAVSRNIRLLDAKVCEELL